VEDLLHVQRPNRMLFVTGLRRAISVWREPNEAPSGVAREEHSTACWMVLFTVNIRSFFEPNIC
jgi:hypothetical protein